MRSTRRVGRGPRRMRALLSGILAAAVVATLVSPSGISAVTSPARLAAAGGVPLADPSSGDGLVAYYPFNYNTPDVAGTTWNGAAEAGDAVLHAGAREVDDYLPPDRDASAVLTLDGVAGSLSSPATVRTDSSFAVAASVKVKSIGRSQVVVSQDGNRVSGFSLRVDPDGTSVFGIPKSDSESAGWDTVKGPKLVAGQWTHLAGVFDAVAGELRLYVNGVRVAAAKHTALWSATGQLQAGRGLSA